MKDMSLKAGMTKPNVTMGNGPLCRSVRVSLSASCKTNSMDAEV